jgi:hypothetical protein
VTPGRVEARTIGGAAVRRTSIVCATIRGERSAIFRRPAGDRRRRSAVTARFSAVASPADFPFALLPAVPPAPSGAFRDRRAGSARSRRRRSRAIGDAVTSRGAAVRVGVLGGPAAGAGARSARPTARERPRECGRVVRTGAGSRPARNSPAGAENARSSSGQGRGTISVRNSGGNCGKAGALVRLDREQLSEPGYSSRSVLMTRSASPVSVPSIVHGEEQSADGRLGAGGGRHRSAGGTRCGLRPGFVRVSRTCAVPPGPLVPARSSRPGVVRLDRMDGSAEWQCRGRLRAVSGRYDAIVCVPGRPSRHIEPRSVATQVNGVAIRPRCPVTSLRSLRVIESRAARPR